MSTIVANCPRCGARHVTFDVLGQLFVAIQYDWLKHFEIFGECRLCHKGTILCTKMKDPDRTGTTSNANGLVNYKNGALNDLLEVTGYVSKAVHGARQPPMFVEGQVATAFNEAATAEKVGCWNASAAMYRACIDLVTKQMLPDEGGPNHATKRNLGLRLEWMFENNLLPPDLEKEAQAIQLDGNDGVHDVSLTEADATDIAEFTELFLERVITQPAKVADAERRRIARRNPT